MYIYAAKHHIVITVILHSHDETYPKTLDSTFYVEYVKNPIICAFSRGTRLDNASRLDTPTLHAAGSQETVSHQRF